MHFPRCRGSLRAFSDCFPLFFAIECYGKSPDSCGEQEAVPLIRYLPVVLPVFTGTFVFFVYASFLMCERNHKQL